jgi:hypothetical protein
MRMKPWLVLGLSLLAVAAACTASLEGESLPASLETPTAMPYFVVETSAAPATLESGTPTLSEPFRGVVTRSTVGPRTGNSSPTLSPLFTGISTFAGATGIPQVSPSLAPFFVTKTPFPSMTLRPTRLPPTPSRIPPTRSTGAASGSVESEYPLVRIYSDALASDWSADESWSVQTDFISKDFIHSGEYALKFTPTEDFGSVFLTLKEGTEPILYDDVLGVVFYINPGDETLYTDQMAVTIIGSNDYTYYRADDNSVALDEGTNFFSETRLYYLGLNQSIPPRNWIEVIVWLDDLPYDPDYTYITGVYFKSGEGGVRNAIYLDDVALILVK